MKIIDIINRVKREEENKSEIDLGNFWEEFGMIWDFMPDPPDKMECYYLYKLNGKGGRIYFLNNEPVCISIEIGHKEKENFEWISEEAFNKTRDYVRSLSSVPLETPSRFWTKKRTFANILF